MQTQKELLDLAILYAKTRKLNSSAKLKQFLYILGFTYNQFKISKDYYIYIYVAKGDILHLVSTGTFYYKDINYKHIITSLKNEGLILTAPKIEPVEDDLSEI